VRSHSRDIQVTVRSHSRDIQVTVRSHSRDIQVTVRSHSRDDLYFDTAVVVLPGRIHTHTQNKMKEHITRADFPTPHEDMETTIVLVEPWLVKWNRGITDRSQAHKAQTHAHSLSAWNQPSCSSSQGL
jgi:hypothetical protein